MYNSVIEFWQMFQNSTKEEIDDFIGRITKVNAPDTFDYKCSDDDSGNKVSPILVEYWNALFSENAECENLKLKVVKLKELVGSSFTEGFNTGLDNFDEVFLRSWDSPEAAFKFSKSFNILDHG